MPILYTGTKLNLGDRVLDEVGKNSFIALPGKGEHSRLHALKNCVPTWEDLMRKLLAMVQEQGFPGHLYCSQIIYCLSYQGSPNHL